MIKNSPFLDFAILFLAQLFALAGKDCGKIIFKELKQPLGHFNYITIVNIVSILTGCAGIVLINQFIVGGALVKMFLFILLTCITSLIVLLKSSPPSILIFFCQVFIFSISIFSFWFREYLFSYTMKEDFWKLIFENLTKIIQFSIVIYLAVIATLKITYDKSEDLLGFSSTIFYPTVIYIIMLLAFGYWILYPVWLKIIDIYKI